MSLRRGVSTLAAALTITAGSAAPAAAHFLAYYPPYTPVPSPTHRHGTSHRRHPGKRTDQLLRAHHVRQF